MGRPRKKPTFMIVSAEVLGAIGEDRVLDLESDPNNCLLDELQCPIFDEVLIALRQSFTLTYTRKTSIDGLQEVLREIRRICVYALRTISEVVEELQLKPVPVPSQGDGMPNVFVFQLSLARVSDLQLKVIYEGKSRKLLNLIKSRPADDVIRTLRDVISDTFEEMHDEEQHEAVLRRIRQRVGSVLPPLNDLLHMIEAEPIADASWIKTVASDEDLQTPSEPVNG